jgi:hypothetical protein
MKFTSTVIRTVARAPEGVAEGLQRRVSESPLTLLGSAARFIKLHLLHVWLADI